MSYLSKIGLIAKSLERSIMGALAGVVYPDSYVNADHLSPMLQIQQHRARGEIVGEHRWRRLHMGCLGQQIAHNEKGSVYLSMDGSLAGAHRLVADLRKSGYPASDDSSHAELLLLAYDRWGRGFVEHVTGHVAVCLFDQQQELLFLCRDRLGRKPLYWYHEGGLFLFSSELKGLLGTRAVPQQPDLPSLAAHLALGYFPQDLSPIQGVSKLLPGHILEFSFKGHKRVIPYWSYSRSFRTPQVDPEERLDQLLTDATNDRLKRYGNMGCLLGGGLGSAAISYYLRKGSQERPLHAYAAVFMDQNEEDGQVAADVAAQLKMPIKLQQLRPDDLFEELPRLVWHLEEPVAMSNLVGTWQLAKLARSEEVVLSGMGCDELLGGHSRYQAGARSVGITRRLAELPNWALTRLALPALETLAPDTAYRVLRHQLTDPVKVDYLHQNALFGERLLRSVAPSLASYWDTDTFIQRFYQRSGIKEGVAALLYLDSKTRLPDAYILQFERLTSAFGLDWQAPFLDSPIVDFLAGVPAELKCTADETAIPLRHILQGQLPDSAVKRSKRERGQFMVPWARHPRVQRAFASLEYSSLVQSGLISRRWLQGRLKRGISDARTFDQLWAILLLEIWFQLFINHPLGDVAPSVTAEEVLGLSAYPTIAPPISRTV